MSDQSVNRRQLISGAASGLVITLISEPSQAIAAKLSPTDPQAAKLGYLEDAKKVDGKRYPTYKTDQTCANCQLIQLRYGFFRPCKLFPNNVVSAKGWCTAWAPKTYK